MKINLVFPPFASNRGAPPAGLSALGAYLRQHGLQVETLDLNVDLLWYFLENWENHNGSLAEVLNRQRVASNSFEPRGVRFGHTMLLLLAEAIRKRLWPGIAKGDPLSLSGAEVSLFERAVRELANEHFMPRAFNANGHLCVSYSELCHVLEDRENDPLLQQFMSRYPWESVEAVGFSVLSESQFPDALLMAKSLRQLYPTLRLIAGGPYITELAAALTAHPDVFKHFDYLVLHEGESALMHICDAMPGDPVKHPNVLSANNLRPSAPFVIEPIDELPDQDFSGFALDRYRVWGLVLPIYSSKGCTRGRCAFCSTNYLKYRERDIVRTVAAVRHTTQVTATDRFQLVDEDVRPARLRRLAELLLDSHAPNALHWMIQTRFYPQLDFDLLSLLH